MGAGRGLRENINISAHKNKNNTGSNPVGHGPQHWNSARANMTVSWVENIPKVEQRKERE